MKQNQKILFTLILITIFSLSSISAITSASLYDRDSFTVRAINYLALGSQITGIYDSFPVTGASVLYTFNQIDRSSLNEKQKALYDKIKNNLNKSANLINSSDGFSSNIQLPITFESFLYETSDNSKLKYYELNNQFKDISPWFDFRTQLYFSNNVFGYTQFAIKDKLNYSLSDEASNFDLNLNSLFSIPKGGTSFEIYQPYKIGISIGDEHYNFQLGKNRLSMGSGISGNFFIGDNFIKQDYFSFSLLSPIFSYTLNVTQFDQQDSSLNFASISFNGKQQYRVMHKVKVNLLKNLSLDVYQGAIYQVDSLNYRMIIPFMYVHNYFNFKDRKIISEGDEANNILGFQTKWVLSKSNEINFIVTFDQIQVFESGEEFPQAYGILLNYKRSKTLGDGIVNESIEAVYTSPYLYLNEKYDKNSDSSYTLNYNYDHIVGNNYGSNDEIGYSGYYYGPDTILLNYNYKYYDVDDWSLGSSLTLRIHGTKGINYNNDDNNGDIIDEVLSNIIVGTPETIISFTPNGSIKLSNNLFISSYLSINYIKNHYNDTSNDSFYNIQGKIKVKLNLF
ncbi:MAG: hypothetical protein PQJ49_11545 [Sphaerochaetaceae bacterium]|nr:hypothetical protein [Sphaerochaetaceae bacterium]